MTFTLYLFLVFAGTGEVLPQAYGPFSSAAVCERVATKLTALLETTEKNGGKWGYGFHICDNKNADDQKRQQHTGKNDE
jgi:hypothetical protein